MNTKLIYYILTTILLFSSVNCKINYIKNYYNIPSYSQINECFKTEFYDYVQFKNTQTQNIKNNVTYKENIKFYKTNLDKIIIFLK